MSTVITVQQLSKRYGTVQAVNDISFNVERGEIFGIIGPNGAGKTTTIEILEGLRKRDGGLVEVLGLDPQKNRTALNEKIGVQYQATSIQKKMKVKEAVDLFSSFYSRKENSKDIIEILGLEEKMNHFFGDLSGGWKQRVTLALATLHQPEIVFLDEPSMGLDPHARRELWSIIQLLRDRGCTIVVTTHYMEEAEKLCDRVAMIYNGEIKALNEPRLLLDEMAVNYLSFYSNEIDELQLAALPGVVKVENEEFFFKVFTETMQQTAYYLFKHCEEHAISLTDFKFEKGTLDDLFVHFLEKGKKDERIG
ncbi:ABC transporter ATP-binding protein [Fictibacillus gelatini]|uniref:ABC transporter ATP-binding protein n=1 Tax=Fictibacillus gelatini TaxID=225985 RepID=UPI00040E21AD|nr:ABC transporter ATP-binding protein [Fictibacillus gelatini]